MLSLASILLATSLASPGDVPPQTLENSPLVDLGMLTQMFLRTATEEIHFVPDTNHRSARAAHQGRIWCAQGWWAYVEKGWGVDANMAVLCAHPRMEQDPPIRVPVGQGDVRDIAWAPDGTSLCLTLHAVGKSSVVKRVVFEGQGGRVEQLSAQGDIARMPQISPSGAVAWVVHRGQQGKMQKEDLIVRDGESTRTLLRDVDITALAWSQEGTRLAVSTHGTLTVFDVSIGALIWSKDFHELDSRLNSYHAYDLLWSPDGKSIAACLRFSGGRAAPMNAPSDYTFPPMLGERELFVIPLEGKITIHEFSSEVIGLEWWTMPHC